MNKQIWIRILLSIFAVLILLLTVGIITQSQTRLLLPPKSPPPPTTSTAKKAINTTKPNDGRTSEFFFRTKNRGSCRSLTGKVLLNFYPVSDGDCIRTENDVATFKQTTDDAVSALERDASTFDTVLKVVCNYVPITYQTEIIREEAINGDALYKMMDTVGLTDRDNLPAKLCNEFATDSAAVILCFNQQERSFAINTVVENQFEFCILYGNNEDFRHELLHLYGARDLYKAERIDAISSRYFYDSIMRSGDGVIIDPLTAFLIGWTDPLNDSAKDFLDAVDR